jgi:hypothetical protein
MANRININGIELTREETFPTIAVSEPKVEETVVEEVKETKKGTVFYLMYQLNL